MPDPGNSSPVSGVRDGDLTVLLARVEAAEGPESGIDGALYTALECIPNDGRVGALGKTFDPQWSPWLRRVDGQWWPSTVHDAPAYTASLDASLGLVERVLPGALWECWKSNEDSLYGVNLSDESDTAYAKTPALALLAAMLKALIAQAADTSARNVPAREGSSNASRAGTRDQSLAPTNAEPSGKED